MDAFAVRGEPEQIPARLLARYGDVCDRVSFPPPAAGAGRTLGGGGGRSTGPSPHGR